MNYRAIRAGMSVLVVFFFVLFGVVTAFAQKVTSDISGTVTDQSGAAVAGAKVTVTNTGTGLTSTTISGKDGLYRIHGLAPGSYEVQAEAQGFKAFNQKGILLSVDQELVVDVPLTVGSSQQSVTVVAEGAQIETTTAQVSSLVNSQTLSDLPLNGRDLFQLTLLQPGVVPTTTANPSPWSTGAFFKAASQGVRPSMFDITEDGADINDPGFNVPVGGPAGVQLGVDATEEFRVVQNAYSAEFGRNAGANIQYVTKSGTNSYHGSIYDYLRNSVLDARNFFDGPQIPSFHRNQFGGNIGGPILKNKLFGFADFEALQQVQGLTDFIDVPDTNARMGLLPSASNPNVLVPITVNPLSAQFLPLWPVPNGPDLGQGVAEWFGSEGEPVNEYYGMGRLDYNFTPKDHTFIRYTHDHGNLTAPFESTGTPGFPGLVTDVNQYAMISWQHQFSNTLFNEAKFAFDRTSTLAAPSTVYPLSISIVPGLPLGDINVLGVSGLGNFTILPLGTTSNVFEGIDNVSKDIGTHALTFGADIKHQQINGPYAFELLGEYDFYGTSTAVSDNPALEAFLEGIPYSYEGVGADASDSYRYYRQNYFGVFAQDNWKVSRRLSLNLGLRWEYMSNPSEKYGRTINIRNVLTSTSPTVGPIFNSMPRDLWSPRVGFAWQPFGTKTVVRGGWGIMRDQLWENLYSDTRLYLPFYDMFSSIGPNFFVPPPSKAAIGGMLESIGSFGITYYPKFPYYYEYSLDIEQQLTPSMLLRVGYAGDLGRHLPRTGEANPVCELQPGIPTSLCNSTNVGENLNPAFGSLPTIETDATSSYDALEISLMKRMTSGLQFQLSYTYSHCLDTASGPYPSDFGSSGDTTQNFFDLQADKGNCAFDERQTFVGNFLYGLPIGAGHRFGNGNPVIAKVLGGWQWNGIVTLDTGAPFTVTLEDFNNSGISSTGGAQSDRPNIVPGATECSVVTHNPNQWFTPGIFTLPLQNTFGDAPRNAMCGPNLRDFDTGLIKQTKVSERVGLEFRAEFFNIFNHPNFNIPDTNAFAGRESNCNPATAQYACGVLEPGQGEIHSTATTSRQIQFALKVHF